MEDLFSQTMEHVVIIGAGPAGLALAYQLSRRGISYRLLDAAAEPAASWAGRHPQLRLNTIRLFSHQPGMRIPRSCGRWVCRDDYIRYLRHYIQKFELPVEFTRRVDSITRESNGWMLDTTDGRITTRHVAICTGADSCPRMPSIDGLETFTGIVRHAREFGEVEWYDEQRVMIIGAGNSAFDIANHLARRPVRELVMSVRTPPSVAPKQILGIPTHALSVMGCRSPLWMQDITLRLISRLFLGDLSRIGLGRAPEGAYTRHVRDGTTVAVDDGFLRQVRQGRARIVPEVVRVEADRAVTKDGETLTPDVILCATGYTPGLDALVGHLDVLDRHGFPTTIGAQPNPALPGLWFLGVRGYIWGNMHEQRRQSRELARAIARDVR